MEDALLVHRLHFAFTVTFHYIFPQLTMGLALLILILKTLALRTGDEPGTARRGSGQEFSGSTSRWGWSPEFRWNFSSAPTGRNFRKPQAA